MHLVLIRYFAGGSFLLHEKKSHGMCLYNCLHVFLMWLDAMCCDGRLGWLSPMCLLLSAVCPPFVPQTGFDLFKEGVSATRMWMSHGTSLTALVKKTDLLHWSGTVVSRQDPKGLSRICLLFIVKRADS